MINLPPQLTPSELLCCEDLPPFIDELLQGSRSLRREGRLPEAERCVLDAMQASQKPGANISQGRNQAIAAAHGPIIAATDAGVVLSPYWLEDVTKPIIQDFYS